ncbi:MAG: hypothetical protein HY560_05335 [Gemmatimonadetes bacterium]|nr:hypothetical protein [Gemmatimonadota bacterium]
MLHIRTRRLFSLATLLAALAVQACDDPLALNPAIDVNVVDTVRLYALRGTDLVLPSGYDLPNRLAARTEHQAFDFAFDITDDTKPAMYPVGALGLSRSAGLVTLAVPFDDVISAPTSGYVDSAAVAVSEGTVFVVRSRPDIVGCGLTGALPRYGKFRVLTVDAASRSVTLEALVNQNCGYRDLRPGLPTA